MHPQRFFKYTKSANGVAACSHKHSRIAFRTDTGWKGNCSRLGPWPRRQDALDDDISDEYIPFSDLKPLLNSYIVDLVQNEWDTYPINKLHNISLRVNEDLPSCRSDRRKETVLSRLYTLNCHSYVRDSFFLDKRRRITLLRSMQRVAFIRVCFVALFRFN